MLYTDYTAKVLGLEDTRILKIEENEKAHDIYIEMVRRTHVCLGHTSDQDSGGPVQIFQLIQHKEKIKILSADYRYMKVALHSKIRQATP